MKTIKKLMLFSFVLMTAAIFSSTSKQVSAASENEIYANTLAQLGLFRGTGIGYELERELTRTEAAVMLVRLLGAEKKALSETYDTPFTDVRDWAKPYVGWLYKHGMVKGIAPDQFGSDSRMTYQQYFILLLRCLDYDDGTDFEYAKTR